MWPFGKGKSKEKVYQAKSELSGCLRTIDRHLSGIAKKRDEHIQLAMAAKKKNDPIAVTYHKNSYYLLRKKEEQAQKKRFSLMQLEHVMEMAVMNKDYLLTQKEISAAIETLNVGDTEEVLKRVIHQKDDMEGIEQIIGEYVDQGLREMGVGQSGTVDEFDLAVEKAMGVEARDGIEDIDREMEKALLKGVGERGE